MSRNLEWVKPNRERLLQISVAATTQAMGSDRPKPYIDIGERLRWHRDLLGLEQAEYIRPLRDVKRAAYSNWETGATRLSLNGALEIRRAYGLSLDFMFCGIDDALSMSLRKEWQSSPRVSHSR